MWLLFACITPQESPRLPPPSGPTEVSAVLQIIDRPLPWDDTRSALTLAYREAHYGQRSAGLTIVPRVVVLHWTATDTADQAWNTFAPSALAGRPELETSHLNVSAHFLVDRDGTIYRLLPETRMARHTIGLNHLSVGIENVGQADLTEAQVQANIHLVRDLHRRFPTITHLIGHHEYRLLEHHPYWAERDPAYRTEKIDPGETFMQRVRAPLRDLQLAP